MGMFSPSIPELKQKLLLAGLRIDPRVYTKTALRNALFISGMLTIMAFFLLSKYRGNLILLPFIFGIFFFVMYSIMFRSVDARIKKRAKMLDKDVLFAGRFLLVKLNSGKPLVNAIIDASKSYGVANTFFMGIARDINLGTPLEKSLDNAFKYCPSDKFKRVLFQITSALRIGVDVTKSLEATLDEIAGEQLVEIQRYGKKLSSFTLFYMLLAIVLPSLGMTLFIVLASFTNLSMGNSVFVLLGFVLSFIQFFFIIIFKSVRPNINI
jgi:archaeal flagellar protein FlaJ